ncbi:thymidylate synthase [Mucilaginibacter sp. KACC 22063]|uniref:thymidylate synthase n=1 Tax=Mucilaginibacter sp. KACC 22063 TaxID=3025666 RepID=UPI00236700DD|nr:thymidylate synthase [Mucilaginibacter sp. KACC 22063]WDF55241.1 thymidylate synthase [Mucilaginibacter sp. KACC 22063]
MPKLNTNTFKTLDDLLTAVYQDLMERPSSIPTTRSKKGGDTCEIIGVSLTLANPRARLSRSEVKGKAFSPVGELLWYLSGSNTLEFIQPYISHYKDETDDGNTIYGAYGPRLLNMHNKYNQVNNIIKLLGQKPTSRRAVIQLFDASDLVGTHKEIPCTCTLQFLLRDNQLNLHVSMRSNDAYMGLPHDVFAFTMLQEIMANILGVDMGAYHHSVGSLHLYDNDRNLVEQYLYEGYQPTKFYMPAMPKVDPRPAIKQIIKLEELIRTDQSFCLDGLDPYWVDIIKMVHIHFLSKKKDITGIRNVMAGMNDIYKMYIEKKIC